MHQFFDRECGERGGLTKFGNTTTPKTQANTANAAQN
jgi:hypothetical protein